MLNRPQTIDSEAKAETMTNEAEAEAKAEAIFMRRLRFQKPKKCNGSLTLEGPYFLNYLGGPEGVIFDP